MAPEFFRGMDVCHGLALICGGLACLFKKGIAHLLSRENLFRILGTDRGYSCIPEDDTGFLAGA